MVEGTCGFHPGLLGRKLKDMSVAKQAGKRLCNSMGSGKFVEANMLVCKKQLVAILLLNAKRESHNKLLTGSPKGTCWIATTTLTWSSK